MAKKRRKLYPQSMLMIPTYLPTTPSSPGIPGIQVKFVVGPLVVDSDAVLDSYP